MSAFQRPDPCQPQAYSAVLRHDPAAGPRHPRPAGLIPVEPRILGSETEKSPASRTGMQSFLRTEALTRNWPFGRLPGFRPEFGRGC